LRVGFRDGEEVIDAPGRFCLAHVGTSASAHDVVGVLHEGLTEGSEHLVDVPRLYDALGEGGVVGLVGSPPLLERERARVLVLLDELEASQPSAVRIRLRPSASSPARTSSWPSEARRWVMIVTLIRTAPPWPGAAGRLTGTDRPTELESVELEVLSARSYVPTATRRAGKGEGERLAVAACPLGTTSATKRPSCSALSTMARPVARLMSRRCNQVSRVKMVSTR